MAQETKARRHHRNPNYIDRTHFKFRQQNMGKPGFYNQYLQF